MHTRHRRKMVHKLSGHPNGLGGVAANGIDETVFLGEEARRHTGVGHEDNEGGEVAKGHGTAHGRKVGVSRGRIVVPCHEAGEERIVSIGNCNDGFGRSGE